MFSIGGSSQSSRGGSVSGSYGYDTSVAGSESAGRSLAHSGQSLAFEDIFAQLYGNAQGATGRAALMVPRFAQDVQGLFSRGGNFLESLSQGPETLYLQERLRDRSPYVDEEIQGLGSDIQEFLTETVNPNITVRGVRAGTLGGDRGEVARGQAGREALRTFTRGVTDIRTRDLAARDAAAGTLQSGRLGGASAGLASLPGLLGLSQAGFGAEQAPYAALAQILGGPTALTESFATSEEMARALSQAFSEEYSRSTSTSRSRGGSFNIGFGPSGGG